MIEQYLKISTNAFQLAKCVSDKILINEMHK